MEGHVKSGTQTPSDNTFCSTLQPSPVPVSLPYGKASNWQGGIRVLINVVTLPFRSLSLPYGKASNWQGGIRVNAWASGGTRRESFNFTPMAVSSVPPARLHVRPMGRVYV